MPRMKNVGGGPGDDDSGRRLPPSSGRDKGKAVQTGSAKKRKRANREADIARAAAAEAVERGGRHRFAGPHALALRCHLGMRVRDVVVMSLEQLH
ncbi:hypothetical protein GQ55_9G392500 [Panicum hallii var. hallii]|uniref:Uncharacterized protein n=1 Tax=Panicum hallii var. hallii TaxID=1504633 RepID=A0A2T7C9N6_9POAL|nr:hypothetical protein GQ55_9G392500 [Panicum hallii var. hallii]